MERWVGSLSDVLGDTEATDGAGAPLDREDAVSRVVELLDVARAERRKVMLFGNGGSAAIVEHMHADLSNGLGVRALLFAETARLTALVNDHGYGRVYEQPVELWADPGDVVIAVSSSGRSENILRAVRAGAERGCTAITLSGFDPENRLRSLGAVNFWVPAWSYGLVETAHAVLAHAITDQMLGARRAADE